VLLGGLGAAHERAAEACVGGGGILLIDKISKCERIEDFLYMYQDSKPDEVISFIEQKFEDLVSEYGYNIIHRVEDACELQITTAEEEKCKKAIKKLTKQQIFEISATVSYLAGMCACYLWKEKGK